MNIDGFILKDFTECSREELKEILEWRNLPEVRRNSFSDEEISLESHLNYVVSLKTRRDKRYYLVKDTQGPLGVVSFVNIDGVSAEAGYYKSADRASQKGVGTVLLKLAEKAARVIGGGKWRFLVTEVFSFNRASVKSVERAGYRERKEARRLVERGGDTFAVLRYELFLREDEVGNKDRRF